MTTEFNLEEAIKMARETQNAAELRETKKDYVLALRSMFTQNETFWWPPKLNAGYFSLRANFESLVGKSPSSPEARILAPAHGLRWRHINSTLKDELWKQMLLIAGVEDEHPMHLPVPVPSPEPQVPPESQFRAQFRRWFRPNQGI